jgi:hypothetical protein
VTFNWIVRVLILMTVKQKVFLILTKIILLIANREVNLLPVIKCLLTVITNVSANVLKEFISLD